MSVCTIRTRRIGEKVVFQFNPNIYARKHTAQILTHVYAYKQAADVTTTTSTTTTFHIIVVFAHVCVRSVSMSMFFDAQLGYRGGR